MFKGWAKILLSGVLIALTPVFWFMVPSTVGAQATTGPQFSSATVTPSMAGSSATRSLKVSYSLNPKTYKGAVCVTISYNGGLLTGNSSDGTYIDGKIDSSVSSFSYTSSSGIYTNGSSVAFRAYASCAQGLQYTNQKVVPISDSLQYNPTLSLVVSAGESADTSGDLYPRLDLNISPPSNLSSYKNTTNATEQYQVLVREGSTTDVNKTYNISTTNIYYMNKPGAIAGMIEASPWLAWKHSYTVTVDVLVGSKVIGEASKGITVNIPDGHNVGKDPSGTQSVSTGSCAIPVGTIKWYPINNTVNDIVFTWGQLNCGAQNFKVLRPDKSPVSTVFLTALSGGANISGTVPCYGSNTCYSVEDSAAQTGWYNFQTYDSNDQQIGTTTAYVDLSKATVQTSEGTKAVSSLPGATSSASAGQGSIYNCDQYKKWNWDPFAMVSNWLRFGVCEVLQVPLAIINWIAGIYDWVTI